MPKQVNLLNNQEDALWEKISGLSRHTLAGPPAAAPDRDLAALFRQRDNIPADMPLAEYLHEQSRKADRAA